MVEGKKATRSTSSVPPYHWCSRKGHRGFCRIHTVSLKHRVRKIGTFTDTWTKTQNSNKSHNTNQKKSNKREVKDKNYLSILKKRMLHNFGDSYNHKQSNNKQRDLWKFIKMKDQVFGTFWGHESSVPLFVCDSFFWWNQNPPPVLQEIMGPELYPFYLHSYNTEKASVSGSIPLFSYHSV